jgi:hypothetical protein
MNGQELVHGGNHTHLPLLIQAVHQTTGPVLEMGTGDASTVCLHALLAGTGRKLYSVDDQPDWIDRYDSLRTDWHAISRVQWCDFTLPEEHFGAVLIDHAPGHYRVDAAIRLKDKADQVVVHDTDAAYGWERLWKSFRYRVDDKRFLPWTSCVSNIRELQT